MQIIVTKQIGVEAETIEEGIAAVAKGEGQTISIGAMARPQQAGQTPGGVITGSHQTTQTIPTPAVPR